MLPAIWRITLVSLCLSLATAHSTWAAQATDALDYEIQQHSCSAFKDSKEFGQFYETARTALILHYLNVRRIGTNEWFIRKELGNAKLLYYGDVTSKYLFIAGIALLPNIVFVDAFGIAAIANATSGTAATLILALPVLGMMGYVLYPDQDKSPIVENWSSNQSQMMDTIRIQNAGRATHETRELRQLSADPRDALHVAHILEDNLAMFREALTVTQEKWNDFVKKNELNTNHEPSVHIALRKAESEIYRRENVYLEGFALALEQFCSKAQNMR